MKVEIELTEEEKIKFNKEWDLMEKCEGNSEDSTEWAMKCVLYNYIDNHTQTQVDKIIGDFITARKLK
jgi:hypothetical protein